MKLCICRNISDKAVKTHLQNNPHLLSQDWKAVSFNMSGQDIVCGKCTEHGEDLIREANTPNCSKA